MFELLFLKKSKALIVGGGTAPRQGRKVKSAMSYKQYWFLH
ncbi:hypothetical protein CWATWH8502_3521 [Crocosphaera watsonii WH 8502]|uniref:Uncharacterized protein n=5 Tax=Crocosphaera watsonii TaxID=263511 RepID=T2JTK5_CROWT|nr:hypothetical protein CWATWH0003_2183 [Crocosphaera watsonii WH 0003]CCQ49308.1 hypothetical protein CWATWH8502_3521 [Crocosphaera watsonii WH 8502]CCQ59282.1 hypothetical protein CWATWH0005_4593 [Crocosphaera watsonii WH 0005]CCQ63147.1 hypothetical protein CWATWH0401_963 [Crocosphaera watsonii WH 0401]CCQ69178.1 hypothetical protein CWATWH0402_6310 [Crocosphaera watsonii WH 0402]